MYGAAKDLGVSYNHLILVLDGKRVPGKCLAAGIERTMNATQHSSPNSKPMRQVTSVHGI